MRKIAFLLALIPIVSTAPLSAQPGPGQVADVSVISGSNRVQVTVKPHPSADIVRMKMSTNLLVGAGYTNSGLSFTGSVAGYVWTNHFTNAAAFYKPEVIFVNSNTLFTATLLNRAAYGPTPDDLDTILGFPGVTNTAGGTNPAVVGIGPAAWLAGQLNPASITEDSTNAHTNVAFFLSRFGDTGDFCRTNESVGPGTAGLRELQAWLVLQGVYGKRQLLEQLTQFFENLHVTQWSKANDFFAGPYNGVPNVANRQAARVEWIENNRRRNALLNPQCTFSNMLLIQAESPSMIIYLDTQTSRSDGGNVPNENYAREIMELFSMGVDNGYDQFDITQMSYTWAGWNCRFVTVANANNVFAPNASTPESNNLGVWAFNFRTDRRSAGTNDIFYNRDSNGVIIAGTNGFKKVPARYGPPWTTNIYGTNTVPGAYALRQVSTVPANSDINQGYAVVKHLADLPFTQEYICYKLCRTFVNDTFLFGPVDGYDFNAGAPATAFTWYNLSDEGRLLRQCMLAWETNSPKGQIYKVLEVIFNSDLFKTNALRQKVKTPMEYTVSAIRSQRMHTNGAASPTTGPTNFAARTDGLSIAQANGSTPILRMGNMGLFDRDTPDGYPEGGTGWISAGTLAERIRFVQTFMMSTNTTLYAADATAKVEGIPGGNNNIADPMVIIRRRLNDAGQDDPVAIANLFLDLLFLGEGKQNLDLYRSAAVKFLNSDAAGNTIGQSYSSRPATGSESREERVRGMVAMLMALPRFNEQ